MNFYLKTTFAAFIISFLFVPFLQAQDYAASANAVTPLLISSEIPDVTVKNIDGETVSLRDKVYEQPSILVFYRGGWCPYCSRHLADLKKIEDDLYEIGYQILAISPDRPEKLRATLNENELGYTLLSDSPMNATKAFGLAFKVDPETVERYKSVGIDLEGDSGYDHHLLPAPAVYIVNTDGIVRFNYVNPNYKERIDGDVLLTAAKAYYEE
ncbi:MAG: AhpC/TSA family protein [Gracilimonas sp.]|uniref:peroxiredoxin-like family protein n=1 Tax=Gracilimonas TaxID=649462 RepID=UPI001B20525E|nr:peroxiredoxin-like family protein [Gracilimonas sp.]MBO6587301.1 AhpC/TSA family protein [Gracilimonas sp.]MBO6614211.1 AhpC/TSA family protein [Gracilimonas sp.]